MKTTRADIEEILQQLTLDEKISLVSGRDAWSTKPIERLGVPSVWVADGPHGLRRAPETYLPGFGDQWPSTCFPTASALAASWNVDLLKTTGELLAKECLAYGVQVILGPGINIKRSPLGGRNFEYFSEDPVLAGELAAAYIDGVQQHGVGTSLKHFACNSQEQNRMVVSSNVDERTLREIYLTNFEIAIDKSNPWTVMAAYNPVNGDDATANPFLLTDILQTEWQYDGVVLSDWVSVHLPVKAIEAGLHIEMPGNDGVHVDEIKLALETGALSETTLDDRVRDSLVFAFKAHEQADPTAQVDHEAHHQEAEAIAADCFVLLKNDHNALPLTPEKYNSVALIGEFAVKPRFQGNGSSEVKETKLTNLKDELAQQISVPMSYSSGYRLDDDHDTSLIAEAVKQAQQAEAAIVHVGLPQHYESEGYDRKHLHIPPAQVALIEAVSQVQANTIVVLTNGAPIDMPWHNNVPAILETWLPGQAGATAIAKTLTGVYNPSGKLPETFPVRLEDTPCFLDFPGLDRKLNFSEGVFVGYRWYDARKIEPLFPFGHGLSYTQFELSDLSISSQKVTQGDALTVQVKVTNSGILSGQEVVQLYVHDTDSRLPRPEKELKRFAKIQLAPGETKTLEFELNTRDLSYFDEQQGKWLAESGDFEIRIGNSSQHTPVIGKFTYESAEVLPLGFDVRTTLREWVANEETKPIAYDLVKDFFMTMPHEIVGDLWDFNIKNDFFMDAPLMKFVALTNGKVTKQQVWQALEQVEGWTRKI